MEVALERVIEGGRLFLNELVLLRDVSLDKTVLIQAVAEENSFACTFRKSG
jgi:hypothetical protein